MDCFHTDYIQLLNQPSRIHIISLVAYDPMWRAVITVFLPHYNNINISESKLTSWAAAKASPFSLMASDLASASSNTFCFSALANVSALRASTSYRYGQYV